MEIALACSVSLEAEPVLRRLERLEPLDLPHRPAWRGSLDGAPVSIVVGGMGKTNAAHSLTLLVERRPITAVASFGVAGAYRHSGLGVGDVALAESEHYGDEGVDTPSGWMSCEGIGIPLAESRDRPYFNDFPVDGRALAAVVAAAGTDGRRIRVGPFVTLSCCSGTAARGDELERRFGAICESMEGAAHAHIAALYGLPFLEVRGISNLVEDRDLGRWRLEDAAAAAASALPLLAAAWSG